MSNKYTEVDFDKRKFKKFGGEVIEDIVTYTKNHVRKGDDMRIIVGCDSQQRRKQTVYAIAIVLYDVARRDGAHIVFMRVYQPKEKDMVTRLWNEVSYSLKLAEWLEEGLGGDYPTPVFDRNPYDGSLPERKIEIHVDVNPDEGINKHNRSNQVYTGVMGMLCGMGFSVRSKPDSHTASYAADFLCK